MENNKEENKVSTEENLQPKEDDLVIGNENEDVDIEDEEDSAIFELPTPHDDIGAAYNALAAVSEIDTALSSKEEVKKINRIKRLSIKIIDEQIRYIHDCIFDENKEDD